MMKKMILFILIGMLGLSAASAQHISPTTGLPIDREPTAPMLVVISNTEADVKYNGHTTTAQGVGKRQAWGGQQADIIYECPLYQDTATRLTYLFHDALLSGEAIEAGPVRSVRSIHVQLTQAWRSGLVYANGLSGNMNGVPQLWDIRDVAFTDGNDAGKPYITPVFGVRAPDHRSVDVNGVYSLMEDDSFRADGLAFTDELPGEQLPKACDIKLNWGEKKRFFSRFEYDETTQTYQWYSNKVPMKNWLDSSRTEESELIFDNVIVQYVPFGYPISKILPETELSGGGRALLFMGGRLVEAEWINRDGSIHYVDAQGSDVPLQRGKTYIAIWPDNWDQLSWK